MKRKPIKRRPLSWHTRHEKEAIKKVGGKPLKKYGYDGKVRGRPVEVREARKDKRFQINRKTHRAMIRGKGTYIFKKGRKTVKVPAKKVSKMIGSGKWFYDRGINYHKFVKVDQIFKRK